MYLYELSFLRINSYGLRDHLYHLTSVIVVVVLVWRPSRWLILNINVKVRLIIIFLLFHLLISIILRLLGLGDPCEALA